MPAVGMSPITPIAAMVPTVAIVVTVPMAIIARIPVVVAARAEPEINRGRPEDHRSWGINRRRRSTHGRRSHDNRRWPADNHCRERRQRQSQPEVESHSGLGSRSCPEENGREKQ